jgi:hypothetical protein
VVGTIYDLGDALGPLAGGLLVASVGYGRMFSDHGGSGAGHGGRVLCYDSNAHKRTNPNRPWG